MKKLFILAMAFGLAACSTDKTEMPEVGSGDVETNYLTVNLVATPATRAVQDADNYEDGTGKENVVTSVRFHFFYNSGDAAAVKMVGSTKQSFLDWTADFGDEGKETPNVEKILAAHLVIETPEGDEVPDSIVAILNPTSEKTYATLALLNEDIANYGITAASTDFVMSNSVYAKGGKIEAVKVTDNLRSTKEAALASPVTIYVERVVAKTSLTVGLNPAGETAGVYETAKPESTNGAEDGKDYTFNGEKIYVKFLGWNVTCHTAKSRLMKEINAGWNSTLFGASEPWNYDPYFRSFWAVNPTLKWMEKTAEDDWAEDTDYIFGSFNKAGDANRANAIEVGASTYMQENASDSYDNGTNPAHPTQVIIAAQLCDEKGDYIEFAEYGFQQFALTNADNKNPLIINYANIASLYTRVDSQEGDVTKQTYTKVSPDDLELKTATQVGKADALTDGRYYVYVQLKADKFAADKWTLSNADNSAYATTIDEINAELIKLGPAKVWTNGYTYYYFDIAHLGESNGSVGVVRNHVYKSNITKLVGLGTPVFDPNETIYPEKPENEDTYLAAQIKILSWRIVNNNVELNWE